MRRAAAQGDKGPTDEQQSGGGWPLEELQLIAGEPQDPTKVSFPFLRRMRNDHMIAFCLYLIEMGCLKAPWYYESSSARVAAFADNLIRPIYGRLVRTILRMIWAGYSPGVKRFKFVQPEWVYFEDGQQKKVWTGPADAAIFRPVVPLKPELCRPRWSGGSFNGIKYDGRYSILEGPGSFIVDGFESKEIDLLHSMWATEGQEREDNNIYGKARISYCAPIFWEYWRMYGAIGRAFEDNADPSPVVRYPRDDPPMEGDDGEPVSPVKTALMIGRRRRTGSTTALPSDPYTTFEDRPSTMTKWGIEYPESRTNFAEMMEWIGMLQATKCQAVFTSEQGVVGQSITGSSSNRNVFEGAGDLRDESLTVLMGAIDEFIDNVFVRPALAMNMPLFEGTIQKKTLGINKDDEDVIRQLFQLVGQEDWRNFGADMQKLVQSRGVPMLDPAARERQMQEIASKTEAAPTPVVEPTQGRRALVTQTGFGETSYVQLGGQIEMADDGDFVADLPKSDHFSDRAVVGSTRRLRGHALAYYAGLYEDFAIYVSKQRSLELAEDGSWVDRLVDRWRPRAQRTKTFTERVRGTLAQVFDRRAALTLKDLVSKTRVDSKSSTRAARWIEQHGGDLVDGITLTTRKELRTFLAREVDRGASPKEVATAIRSEFSEWPGWKADRLALTEIPRAYNFSTLVAGEIAGVKKVQLIDGDHHDRACRERDGRIVSIKQAFKEDLAHPRCGLSHRLLPQDDLEVVRSALEDGLLARYDEDTQTILLSPDLDDDVEREYALAIGAKLSASPNGHHHPEAMATIE